MKFTLKLISSLVLLATLTLVVTAATGWNPAVVGSVFTVITIFAPMPKSVLRGVVLETWGNYIIERFWKDNAFLKFCFDDSDKVLAGRIVHIPQPGAKPNVVKNRSVYPATSVRRTDTDVMYPLDEYSTDPTHIPNIDAIHLSFNKQDSVLGDHMGTLTEQVADDVLIKWAANAPVVLTTGGTAANTVAPVPGQIGTRKAFDQADLLALMIRFNLDKVSKQDRYVMIDDYMYAGFYNSIGATNAKDFSRYADAENGVVGKLHSFNIMTRASILMATNTNAIKPLGALMGATDALCSLAWQKNSLAVAIGDKKLFANTADALYQGDVYSCLLMAGARVRRADSLGVMVIAQGV